MKRYEIRIASPAQPVRYATTKIGAKLRAGLLRLTTFGLKTVTVIDSKTGAVISRG